MNINDMNPGPVLDRIVFEKILKWETYRPWPGTTWYVYPDNDENGKRIYCDPGIVSPSETWEGMRLVVEEMQRRGYRYLIHDTHNGIPIAQFEKYDDNYDLIGFGRSSGKTAPHAVTVAAIKAIQGEDTQ